MGVKRFEMRLIEGYLKARLSAVENETATLDALAFAGRDIERRKDTLDGREAELRGLLDIFGAFD